MSTGVFFLARKCDWRSRSLEKTCLGCTQSWGRRSDWLAVSYCTDQLLTPNFSGGSTLNGTPGGNRWVRVLCGQIGWLSDHLRRVHAGCSETGSTNDLENANSWKAREKKSPHPKHTTKFTAARPPRPTRDAAGRNTFHALAHTCLLYTSPSPRD